MKRNRRRKSNFCYGESSFIFPNQFLCRRIKLRETDSKLVAPNQIWYTFRFASSNRILLGGYINQLFFQQTEIFSSYLSSLYYSNFCSVLPTFFFFFLLRIIILQNKTNVAIESDFLFWWSWRANNIILIGWYKR